MHFVNEVTKSYFNGLSTTSMVKLEKSATFEGINKMRINYSPAFNGLLKTKHIFRPVDFKQIKT